MSCTKVDLANKNNHSRMQLFGQISYLQIVGTRVNITQTLGGDNFAKANNPATALPGNAAI